ncbi:MAG TPA: VWA domain-containing protein [Terracidiphilus sp.]|nr:VWA domain-containing protein [Terracidiphilus sp.]
MQLSERGNGGIVLALAGVLLGGLPCRGQAPDQAPAVQQRAEPATAREGDKGRMTIHVTVTDKLGHHLDGLQASDFTLLDNKEPQKLLDFRATDERSTGDPARVVVVLDTINVDFNVIAWVRQQVDAYLKEDGGKLGHPTTIAILSDRGIQVAPGWTEDGNELMAAFDKSQSQLRIVGRSAGFYGATERLEMSLGQLGQLMEYESHQPGRKLMLTIGQGWPLLPMAGFEEDMNQRDWVFNTIVHVTDGLRAAGITLYCLDPFQLGRTNPYYYQSYLKPVPEAKNAEYPDLALQVLAEHSGGEVVINGHDITDDLNLAVRDAGAGYDLTFEAPPGDRPNEYHALQVQVDKPNAKVRTVAGYYARPEAVGEKKKKK